MRRLKCANRQTPRGQVVIESIASIILFTIMITMVMSLTLYLYFQQAIVTSAREGARQAAMNTALGSAAGQASGISTVTSFVENNIQQLTGQDPSAATITVTPPAAGGTVGQRTVQVAISYPMTNPINVSGLLEAFGADASAFSVIPVNASATMRYEE